MFLLILFLILLFKFQKKKRFFNMEGMVHAVITTLYLDSIKMKIILSGFSIYPIFLSVCNIEKLSFLQVSVPCVANKS